MQFDFDERYQQLEPVGRAISRREGVLLAAFAHALVVGAVFAAPHLMPARTPADAVKPHDQLEVDRDVMRFVLAPPPMRKASARPPPHAVASDADSVARSPERAENHTPPSAGDFQDPADQRPDAPRSAPLDALTGAVSALADAPERFPLPPSPAASPSPLAAKVARGPGVLADAIGRWPRYVDGTPVHNPNGGVAEFGPQIQFDSKGADFGPWIRRFIAQVKRNWLIPNAVLGMHGRVVVQFNVHRAGALTNVTVVSVSPVDSFNRAAVNALIASNPTQPLPSEYPDDAAFFTVTFYYNEPVVP